MKSKEVPSVSIDETNPFDGLDSEATFDTESQFGSDSDSQEELSTDTLESLEDLESRHEAIEKLGESYAVRRTIREGAITARKDVEQAWAEVRAVTRKPGELIKKFTHDRAEGSLARKQARLDRLGDNSVLRRHYEKSVEKAKKKESEKRQSIEEHQFRTQEIIDEPGKKAEQKKDEYRDEILSKKEQAEGRKALRKELKQNDASILEKRRIKKELLGTDTMRRIGRMAIMEEVSDKFLGESKEAVQGRYVQERLQDLSTEIDDKKRDAEETIPKGLKETHFEHIKQSGLLEESQKRLESIKLKLDGLKEGDSDYDYLMSEKAIAESSVRQHSERQEKLTQKYDQLFKAQQQAREEVKQLEEQRKTLINEYRDSRSNLEHSKQEHANYRSVIDRERSEIFGSNNPEESGEDDSENETSDAEYSSSYSHDIDSSAQPEGETSETEPEPEQEQDSRPDEETAKPKPETQPKIERKQKILGDFRKKREQIEQMKYELENDSKPGFKMTPLEIRARDSKKRDIEQAHADLDREWQRLGGDKIDQAQKAIDSLDFKATPTERLEAKRIFYEAEDSLYDNYVEEQKQKAKQEAEQ